MPPEPGALVEPVPRPSGEPDLSDQLEECALGRRSPERKPEENGLTQALAVETTHLGRHPKVETRSASRAGDGHERWAGSPRLRQQDAAIERNEARAPPPPTCEQERHYDCDEPERGHYRHRRDGQPDRNQREKEGGLTEEIRRCEARAE